MRERDMVELEGLDALVLLPARLAAGGIAGPAIPRGSLRLPGGALLTVFDVGQEVIVSPLVTESGAIRRAVVGDGAFAGILAAIGAGDGDGSFRAERWRPVPPGRVERAIDVDQSNESVVVGDAVVKLYPRTPAARPPGLDVPAHLAAVGFDETPTVFGALTWSDGAGREVLLASAAAYLPGARDGWDWFVELVERAADGALAWPDADQPARAIGDLVARLHLALATPSTYFPSPLMDVDATRWLRGARETLEEALAVTSGEAGDRLRSMAPAAAAAIGSLADVGVTAAIPLHGDLHVGQILRWDGGLAVSDFDGDPIAPAAWRSLPGAPTRDVAAMARAIDHVGRIVTRRRPGRAPDVSRWAARARAAFLDAYRVGLGANASVLFDERLLHPFEVVQECHEYVYAARYLPSWGYVPDAAMPELLGAGP